MIPINDMTRKGWIIAGVALVLIVASLVVLDLLTSDGGWRTMQGPVAVIQGPVPTNGFLGVEFKSDGGGAAEIASVVAGSGAAEAGLQADDLIVAVGGVSDPDAAAVKRATQSSKPGDLLAMRVRRGTGERDVAVRLISFEQFAELRLARSGDKPVAAAAAATTTTTTTTTPAPSGAP